MLCTKAEIFPELKCPKWEMAVWYSNIHQSQMTLSLLWGPSKLTPGQRISVILFKKKTLNKVPRWKLFHIKLPLRDVPRVVHDTWAPRNLHIPTIWLGNKPSSHWIPSCYSYFSSIFFRQFCSMECGWGLEAFTKVNLHSLGAREPRFCWYYHHAEPWVSNKFRDWHWATRSYSQVINKAVTRLMFEVF